LGLALSKSIAEIRALPYPEYRSWELFYLLEPFGFENNEYLIAAILAMIYNVNRAKGKAKQPKDFMRNMLASLVKQIQQPSDITAIPREKLIRQIKKDFGIE